MGETSTLSIRAAEQAEARARVAMAQARMSFARQAQQTARRSALAAEQRQMRGRGGAGGPQMMASLGGIDGTRRHRLNDRPRGGRAATIDALYSREERGRHIEISRELSRENMVAQSFINRIVDFTIGAGFTLEAQSPDSDWNRRAEEDWAEWFNDPVAFDIAGQVDGNEHLRVCKRQSLVDGDIAILRLRSGHTQMIDAERIGNPGGRANSAQMVNGVETDPLGRPIAYHISDYDPTGRMVNFAAPGTWHPAGAVSLFMRREWAVQQRGEPRLASIADDLWRLDDYIVSTEEAAHIATLFSLYTRTKDPWLMAEQLGGDVVSRTTRAGDNQQRMEVELEPGLLQHLDVGEDLVQVKPEQPTTSFEMFLRMRMRMLGNRVDLPLELAMLDFSISNFHGALAAVDAAWTSVVAEQMEIKRYLARLYRWRIGRSIMAGRLEEIDRWDHHHFVGPPKPNLDPNRKAKTDQIEIMSNLASLRQKLAERGITDWVGHLKQIAAERTMQRELKIEPVAMPGAKVVGEERDTDSDSEES